MARVVCCGFALSQRQYCAAFRLVEVQQTFYQPPQLATCRRWREQAPPDFEFTLKAWLVITHRASSPTYLRLHDGPGGRHQYTEEELASWDQDWGPRDAYILFNNLSIAEDAAHLLRPLPPSPVGQGTAWPWDRGRHDAQGS